MNNNENLQGILINAVSSGGADALWRIARSSTPLGETAREVIELATSPMYGEDLSVADAIILVTKKKGI